MGAVMPVPWKLIASAFGWRAGFEGGVVGVAVVVFKSALALSGALALAVLFGAMAPPARKSLSGW